jgi:hypothetical protein
MRPWIYVLLLGAGLIAASAEPAAANNMTARSPDMALSRHVQAPFLRHRHLPQHGSVLGPFVLGAPFIWPGGYFDGSLASAVSPPVIVLSTPPAAAAPQPSPVEQRASVETTAEGVVIVRGPGSRHLRP